MPAIPSTQSRPYLTIDTPLKAAGIIGIPAALAYCIGNGTSFAPRALQLISSVAVGFAAGMATEKIHAIFSKTIHQSLVPPRSPVHPDEPETSGTLLHLPIDQYTPLMDSVDFEGPFEDLRKQILELRKCAIINGNERVLSDKEVQKSLHMQAMVVKCAYEEESSLKTEKPYVNFKFIPCEGIPLTEDMPWEGMSENTFKSSSPSVASLEVGICEARGLKPKMEDYSIALEIEVLGKKYPLFGVFDGHGGAKAAEYLKKNLPEQLQQKLEFFAAQNSSSLTDAVIYNALKATLVGLDKDYKNGCDRDRSGSTANVVFIADSTCYTANVGDSRSIAIMCKDKTVTQLSKDAKVEGLRHQKIIQFLGGSFTSPSNGTWRINGRLGVGSAIGDKDCKGINPTVEITKTFLPETQETILILGCDGVWNHVLPDQLKDAICSQEAPRSAKQLAEDTFYSVLKNGTRDNVTALVVKIPAAHTKI